MNDIRRGALAIWMITALIGPALLSGCGSSYSDEPLLTIDSPEMQQRQSQANGDSETDPAAESPEPSNDVSDSSDAGPGKLDGDVTAGESPAAPATTDDARPTDDTREQSGDDPPADVQPETFPGDPRPPGTSKPREVKLLVPDKKFRAEGPDGALRVSYDDLDLLKVLNMDPVSLDADKKMPKWLKDLDGKRIRLRGFMFPPFMNTGISVFVLARDTQICCFGRNPKPYDVIRVVMREGVTTDYIELRPFDVVGKFHIEMLSYDDEKVDGVYYIDDAVIIQR